MKVVFIACIMCILLFFSIEKNIINTYLKEKIITIRKELSIKSGKFDISRKKKTMTLLIITSFD